MNVKKDQYSIHHDKKKVYIVRYINQMAWLMLKKKTNNKKLADNDKLADNIGVK